MSLNYKKMKYKTKDYCEIDFDEKVLISKRLINFALCCVQDMILLEQRHNHNGIENEFTDEEIQNYLKLVENESCPDGLYQLMELFNGEKFND